MAVPALGWSKPAASRGQMDVAVTLDTVPRVDSVSVAAAGLTATGDVTLGADGNLDRARATSLKIGNWLDVSAEALRRPTLR